MMINDFQGIAGRASLARNDRGERGQRGKRTERDLPAMTAQQKQTFIYFFQNRLHLKNFAYLCN
jgi:hypothetical protein